MKCKELGIVGAFVLEEPTFQDNRGAFQLIWDAENFYQAGIVFEPSSACQSHNDKSGTLRGMHFQKPPYAQAKVVSCVAGAVWDVIVDLRQDSPSYLRWAATELSESNGAAVFIPRGCAHGFLTLQDNSTVTYLIDGAYHPASARIVRWNDPLIGIPWSKTDPIISEQDRLAPGHQK